MLNGLGKKELTAEYIEQLRDACVEGTSVYRDWQEKPFKMGYRTENLPIGFGLNRSLTTPEGLEALYQKYDCRNGGDPHYGDEGNPVGAAFIEDPRVMCAKGFIRLRQMSREDCITFTNRVIKQFNKEISQAGNDEDKKLGAIANFCQDMEIGHVFPDGNIRYLSFVVLPKLLVENNLSPTIMHDPNVFDDKSNKELKHEIRKGQEFYKSLLE